MANKTVEIIKKEAEKAVKEIQKSTPVKKRG